jgi:hypothetical protein
VKSIKHTIQCHCILPQYRNRKDPVFHKFVAFGVIDDSDTLISKYINCNHCSAVHKIYDVCKSEIVVGKEDLNSVVSIDDLTVMMPEDIVSVLESYNCNLPEYEHAFHILQNKLFSESVTLTRDIMENEVLGKRLKFNKLGLASIESFVEKFDEKI